MTETHLFKSRCLLSFGGAGYAYYLHYGNSFMGIWVYKYANVQTYQIVYVKYVQLFVYQL